MKNASIDRLFVAVADASATAAIYSRFGIACTDDAFHVGGVEVEFVSESTPWGYPIDDAAKEARGLGRSLFAIGIRDPDIVEADFGTDRWGHVRDWAWVPRFGSAGADFVLYSKRRAESRQLPGPLKRLDHLAAVCRDLDERTRCWTDDLGVPLAGEVIAPTMVIRQFRLGDAIFELLGPNGADSPLHKRPPGLVSLASWEVDDLDAVVAQARAAGFTPSDPATGVLPGTRTATIPAAELGGVAMQLLQYVER